MTRPLYIFPGCLIPTRLPFLEAASRFVLDRMGADCADLPGATCCVEPIGLRTMARETWLASSARLLAIAEEGGRDVLTLCNGCYMSLKEAHHALEDDLVRRRVNEVLGDIGREYRGEVQIHHLPGYLLEHEEGVRRLITRPMGLRLAPHPGCHMLRPSEVLRLDRSFRPEVLDKIASWAGATVDPGPEWPACCGGGLAGIDEVLSAELLMDSVRGPQASKVDAILTPCPFCFVQFDIKQKEGVPVLYLAELMALAMGASPERIGLRYHRTKIALPSP
ncbi:MAG: CoB--CoM heterodisulfide reductase subunit B [Methanomassiliicoccales archaeon PtaB.Bin134]|jgi:heterodisulfide reductase subunit B|nr:MAG: CoB--CoM heterodisulfide reductase subunit B [Methanomassiliicoccales archaeon PtaB.Bin134]